MALADLIQARSAALDLLLADWRLLAAKTPRDPASAQRLLQALAWMSDLGRFAEAYDVAEDTLGYWLGNASSGEGDGVDVEADDADMDAALLPDDGAGAARLPTLCRCYLGQMDLLRKRELERHERFFHGLVASADPYRRAHACSGIGLALVLRGRLDAAAASFAQAAKEFRAAGAGADALKMDIRCATARHHQGRDDLAEPLSHATLAAAKELGVDGISPLVLSMGLLGSICYEAGRRFEARTFLRDAAKISQTLPPTAATASAFFQYGQILLRMHDAAQAIPWLERARELQKRLEPVAWISTMVALLRALRGSGRHLDALALLEPIRKAKLLHCEALAVQEFYEDAVATALLVQRRPLARELLQECGQAIAALPEPEFSDPEFFAKLEAQVREHDKIWSGALCVSAKLPAKGPQIEAFLDLHAGFFLKKQGDELLALHTFKPDGAIAVVALALQEQQARGEACVPKHRLATVLAAAAPDAKETARARKLDRSLARLAEWGLCCELVAGHYAYQQHLAVRIRPPFPEA